MVSISFINGSQNFSRWIRCSGQGKSVFEFDETKDVATRVDSRPILVVGIQNPIVSLRCTGEKQGQLSGIGRILRVSMSADFFIFVAEDTNVSDVDGCIVAFGICGTDAMGISGLEKAWNTLDLVPISKIGSNIEF